MYKKITHHITEEHFGHPVATQIKKVIDKNHPEVKTKYAQMTQSAFKQNVANYWTNYSDAMNQVITQVNGTEQDLMSVEDRLFNNIDSLGTTLKAYYGTEFGEKFISNTRMLALTMIQIVRLLRDHSDIKNVLNNRVYNLIANDIAQQMQQSNNIWNFTTIKSEISSIADQWVAQAKAVQAKDTGAATIAKNTASAMINMFATELAAGTTKQYPEKFATV